MIAMPNGHVNFALSIGSAIDNQTRDTDLLTVVNEILGDTWRQPVERIRDAYAHNDAILGDRLKRALPAVLWSGTFSKRTADALKQHSGLVHVDLDGLGDQRESWRDLIWEDPHTLFCMTSPSGTGLKVVYRCDPKRPHIDSFRAAERHVLEKFGLTADPACKDVNRLCFVSWDPEAFLNVHATPLAYPPERVEFKAPAETMPGHRLIAGTTPGDDYNLRGDWQSVLKKHGWKQSKTDYWTRPGKDSGVSASWNKSAHYPNRFYVLSSNAAPFKEAHLYTPWHIFALLECNGDFSRAARELGGQGFGEQRPKSQSKPKSTPEVHDPGYEEAPQIGNSPDSPDSKQQNPADDWPEPVSAEELCANPPPKPPVLIEAILYCVGTMLLAGPSKSHKTFSALDVGIAIASGGTWLGYQTTQSKVLYLNLELQDFATEDRISRISAARGIKPPKDLRVWNLRGRTITLASLTARLPAMIQKYGCSVVCIDPHYKISAVSDMEENSNDSQGKLLTLLEGLCVNAGAALILTHHFAKGDASAKNAIDRASGGGVFARWGDVMLTFTPHEEDDAMTVEMSLRNFAPVEPFVVRWEYPRWTRDKALDPSKLKTNRGPKPRHTTESVLFALGDNLLTYSEWLKASDMSESTFKRKMNELIDARKVVQQGVCYRALRLDPVT